RRDRGCEHASASVSVARLDAMGRQLYHLRPVPVDVQAVTLCVTSLQHYSASAQREEVTRCRPPVIEAADGSAQQHLSLRQVWCQDRRQRNQALSKYIHRVVTKQFGAALRHHDRIDDEFRDTVLA